MKSDAVIGATPISISAKNNMLHNKPKFHFFLLLFSCLLTLSCVGTNTKSTVINNYTGEINRVLLTIESEVPFKAFSEGLSEELYKEFGLRNIHLKSKFLFPSPANRDTSMLKYLNKNFDTDWLLEIKQTRAYDTPSFSSPPTYNGSMWVGGTITTGQTELELELTLTDYRTMSTIWTSTMKLSSGNGITIGGLKDGYGKTTTARKIMKTLTKDGLLIPFETR